MNQDIKRIEDCIGRFVLGKEREIRLALSAIVGRGHILIEDVPGVGKTLLAHSLARALGLRFSRVQFTSDLLPADVLGVSVFDRDKGTFEFHPGPVFAQIVLADEINRAQPKTQSALLEAMEERQVTVEGSTRELPSPFFVIATQNPLDQVGTFPLPESQLDRFLLRISLGYPDRDAERRLWTEPDRRLLLADLEPCVNQGKILELQDQADKVHVGENLLSYIQRLVESTRKSGEFRVGISPRGGAAIVRAAKAWAFIGGRDFVIPEDVKEVLPSVMAHRLSPSSGTKVEAALQKLIAGIPVEL